MELYLDLDAFLELEKERIRAEKQRLGTPSSASIPTFANPNSKTNSHKSCGGEDVPKSVSEKVVKGNEELNGMKCKRSSKTLLNESVIEQQEIADEVHQSVNHPPPLTPTVTSSAFMHANNTEPSVLTSAHTTAEMEQEPPIETVHKTAHNQKSKLTENLESCEKEEKQLNCAYREQGVSSCSEGCADKKTEKVSRDEALGKGWSKIEKDMANRQEFESTTSNTHQKSSPTSGKGKMKKHENVDDMDQWVSDTFYSYFPGFNNEYQKRQNYLRERQLEYQQNLLKHQQQQLTRPSKSKDAKLTAEPLYTSSTHSGSNTSNTDKTDLEIIVNNPNYAPKYTVPATPRPGSTRHKLLQDLRHTELSNMIAGDGVIERNRHTAEIELARKKDYQRELMQQIEEKRRSIELLREEERRQEEALTRRLQEQLQTIQLEEDLEKERLRAEKLRLNTEQNRAMRERLLAKLENDSRLLNEQKVAKKVASQRRSEKAEAEAAEEVTVADVGASLKSYSTDSSNKNKVYKYFSNSARHEYRCGQPLRANVELDWDLPQPPCAQSTRAAEERECFHLSDKVCPMCEAPLKNYESCCLRCQRKLSMNLKPTNGESSAELQDCANGNKGCRKGHGVDGNGNNSSGNGDSDVLTNERSYSLVCSKCERCYSLCSNCLVKSDVCRACRRQRNVCMNCRRTLCSFCLEEIASGRDTERCHVNDQPDNGDVQNEPLTLKNHDNVDGGGSGDDDELSFQILEVKYAAQKANRDENKASVSPPALPSASPSVDINYNINNNYNNYKNNSTKITNKRPPYTINIERNSIFHPSYEPTQQPSTSSFEQLPKIIDTNLSIDLNSTLQTDDNSNLERIRKETDRRLMRYLKNYGDLAKYVGPGGRHQRSESESHDRSTQTTPLSVARRDVVLHEEHNLSMPLLREMPRMTRKEAQTQQKSERQTRSKNSSMDNLKSRWEIPAVQKYTISKSPPVLTQVGAMRKELQVERIMSEHY